MHIFPYVYYSFNKAREYLLNHLKFPTFDCFVTHYLSKKYIRFSYEMKKNNFVLEWICLEWCIIFTIFKDRKTLRADIICFKCNKIEQENSNHPCYLDLE
jgi:hypothetical protein